MSVSFARTDTSVLGRWWWTIDRWILIALGALIGIGIILTFAASPPSAGRIGLDSYHFVKQQMFYVPMGVLIVLSVSLLSPRGIKRIAIPLFFLALAATALTLVAGAEIKGARRWLSLAGMSVQPSELLKPTFAVFAAWLFSLQRLQPRFPGNAIAIVSYVVVAGVLILQPDLGMTGVITAVWFTQFFVSGLRIYWIALIGAAGIAGLVGAYAFLPHVTVRINSFLDPQSGDTYQVDRSLEAFMNGGFFGRGPGEGTVKASLPDAHSDFIFAVAGEEFGMVTCLVIIALYGFIVLRGFARVLEVDNLFVLLAAVGLATGFGLQAFVNMASTLSMIPTKGMTLPFISYGGSSLMALAFGMGMLLALTRRRAGAGELR
ncbi:MAG: FtsW/RodA/SpoVE family cell cycle protein [Candidatus Eiseniibacteriota bacterium]